MNNRIACGWKGFYLEWCDGKTLCVYDVFGIKYKMPLTDFKLTCIETRSIIFPWTIDKGYLKITHPNGSLSICPWEIYEARAGLKSIRLPLDNFEFMITMPL